MRYPIGLLPLFILIISTIPVSATPIGKEGSFILDETNNWVFDIRTEVLTVGSTIRLIWSSNGTSTGWISCNEENQIAKAINSTQIGQISLTTETEKTCGVVIYRVFKPNDNTLTYLIKYYYEWDLLEVTSEETLWYFAWIAFPVIYLIRKQKLSKLAN